MAAVTAADVTVVRSWETVDRAGCVREKVSDLIIALSTAGSLTTNTIGAAALGFTRINSAYANSVTISSTKGVTVGVSTDGLFLFVTSVINATDANRADPADITGTLYVRVTGLP